MKLGEAIEKIRDVCRIRHMSLRTERSYCAWARRYAQWLRGHGASGGSPEAKMEGYLTYLAKTNCAASTQNQAFNAILFLYRESLGVPLGDVSAMRARRPQRMRQCPSLAEVRSLLDAVRDQGGYPTRLIVHLIYACGLRVNEPLNLRVRDVDLEGSRLMIRGAKGDKDRVVALPCSLVVPLREQIRVARRAWQTNVERGIPVPLPGLLAKKYRGAPMGWAWFWVFPSARPCQCPRSGATVQWRVHESNVQRAVRKAAAACGLAGILSPHCLRHAYATHVLEAGASVRDVQAALGHAHLDTTAGYIHPDSLRVRSPLSAITTIGGK